MFVKEKLLKLFLFLDILLNVWIIILKYYETKCAYFKTIKLARYYCHILQSNSNV